MYYFVVINLWCCGKRGACVMCCSFMFGYAEGLQVKNISLFSTVLYSGVLHRSLLLHISCCN